MNAEAKIKILICDMHSSDGSLLQWMLVRSKFKNVTFQPDITELKEQIYFNKPDVIISGDHLWKDEQGIHFITELVPDEKAQVVIWSDNPDEKILSLRLKTSNLHFVKKTNHEKELIETILRCAFQICTSRRKIILL